MTAGVAAIWCAFHLRGVFVQQAFVKAANAAHSVQAVGAQEALLEKRQAARVQQERLEAARVAWEQTQPGYRWPPEEWLEDAGNAKPFEKPGIYWQVPSLTDHPFTYNIYLPRAYDDSADARFPWLTISHPGSEIDFFGLEEWAERNDVILIVMNDSNNGNYERNGVVQDAGLYTAGQLLRLDMQRGIALGSSGGARTSWDMVNRYPAHFMGLCMIAYGAGDGPMTPRHVRLGFIHGDEDFNAPYVRKAVPRLMRNGRAVLHYEFPGGHEAGPLALRERVLDWLLTGAA